MKVDFFPLQFLNFANNDDQTYQQINLNLVQGRFQESLMRKAAQFSNFHYLLPDFESKEPGLSISYKLQKDKNETLENHEKLFGVLSQIFSIAILEKINEILQLTQEDGSPLYYFAKPYEAFCKENIQFIKKYLKSMVHDSGLSKLMDDKTIHESSYKQLDFQFKRGNQGQLDVKLSLSFGFISKDKKAQSLDALLNQKGDISKCKICKKSQIFLYHDENQVKTLYDLDSANEEVLIKVLRFDKTESKDLSLTKAQLQSERYVADLHFSKDGIFYHKLINNQAKGNIKISFQEYFPKYAKPYLHELKIFCKDQDTNQVSEIFLQQGQLNIKYDDQSNSLISFKDLIIPPHSEMLLKFGLKKLLIEFEEYTNDPNRGFDVQQMPIFYKVESEEKWKMIQSESLLIKTPEPDFSMPFNVNAVTNALIGFLFINTYNTLVKPRRLIR